MLQENKLPGGIPGKGTGLSGGAQQGDRDRGPEPCLLSNHDLGDELMNTRPRNSRCHEQRFIHVERQGWYLRTREGLKGPFENRRSAQNCLDDIISKNEITICN